VTAHAPEHTPFPVRGTPGGWRDSWDAPDDSAQLRSEAEALERRMATDLYRIGQAWRQEIEAERKRRRNERQRRR